MSYCRFSSDDHGCDIYAFSADGGVEVHVAFARYVFCEALPPCLVEPKGGDYFERHAIVSDIISRSETKPIGLSRDGRSYWGLSFVEAVELLEDLRSEGYHVPQYAIDALREEACTCR